MKLLEYHPLTVDEALNNFMGWMDELLFEERSDVYQRVVDSYVELRRARAEESLRTLREFVALHGELL